MTTISEYCDTGGSDIEVDESSAQSVDQQVILNNEQMHEATREKRLLSESDEVGEFDSFTTIERKTRNKKYKKTLDQNENKKKEGKDVLEFNDLSDEYVVSITSREVLPKQFGMAKLLRSENIQNIMKISYRSPYRVFVYFESRKEGERLVNCTKMEALGYRCQMIDDITLSYGLVRQVDLDIDEKEALECLSCDYEILSIKRLKRLAEEGKWVDSETIRLSIKGSTLPPYVFGYGCRFKVEPYTFPVSQCSGCWKFGHLSRACPAKKPVCPKCGESHKNCDTDKLRCVNCKGSHMALYKQCPVFLKEKELRYIMSKDNCTYRKALIIYTNKKDNFEENGSMQQNKLRKNAEVESENVQTSQAWKNYENKPSYRNVLITEAIVHREDSKLDNDVGESEKSDLELGWKKIGKRKKKKMSKKNLQTEEVMDLSENEIENDSDNKVDNKNEEDNYSRLISGLRQLVKGVKKIFDSGDSFEDKLKSVCSLVLQDIVRYVLSLVKKEKLLSQVITFLSGDSYS